LVSALALDSVAILSILDKRGEFRLLEQDEGVSVSNRIPGEYSVPFQGRLYTIHASAFPEYDSLRRMLVQSQTLDAVSKHLSINSISADETEAVLQRYSSALSLLAQ
jgi:hypothetical protein